MKTRDHHTSEDLTQETFLHFLENHIYREAGKQMAYLYVIARNLCNDYYRSGTRNEIPTENKQEKEVISSNTSFEQMKILDALERLEPLERELILLRYINKESVGRIAKLTQMSRFSVYRRIQAAFLSQILGNHSAAMGVMVLVMLLSLLNIPENFRVISQI
jgi:RNA polymerase sigma-70 factor (ECF subfamily)